MNKALVLLAALTLCCCITALNASRYGCRCKLPSLVSPPVHPSVVSSVMVTPPSGRCRKVERIIYRKNGTKVCVSPDAKWFPELLKSFDENKEIFNSTSFSSTVSTTTV
ncbi:C-X-C motif chemokine 13 [Austrofundulus limnaeus]|uniref:C-X-C motif chemokine 13 n=1 Tax=Austrofundulus limnaeus TaxID=52670 RepID=A0A2I4BQL5_AUSLI|nr:PREDICTED: C-X-C motif chemokine 13-like [Austrofundulus limnaeus]